MKLKQVNMKGGQRQVRRVPLPGTHAHKWFLEQATEDSKPGDEEPLVGFLQWCQLLCFFRFYNLLGLSCSVLLVSGVHCSWPWTGLWSVGSIQNQISGLSSCSIWNGAEQGLYLQIELFISAPV